jgi:hypothetical protein
MDTNAYANQRNGSDENLAIGGNESNENPGKE